MNNPYFATLGRPVAVCLVVGALTFLTDYQASSHLQPALIDGAKVALEIAAGWLGVNGAIGGVRTVQAARAARAQGVKL